MNGQDEGKMGRMFGKLKLMVQLKLRGYKIYFITLCGKLIEKFLFMLKEKRMSRYEKLILQLKKDNATNYIIPDSMVREDKIKFTCKCGEDLTKLARSILTGSGAKCDLCMRKLLTKHGKDTQSVDDTNTRKEKRCKKGMAKTAKNKTEDSLRKARDEKVSKVNTESLCEEQWFTHPVFTTHEANVNGDVRRKARPSLLLSLNPSKSGYTTFTIDSKKQQKHRFIVECIYAWDIPKEYDVDHIDGNKSNNKLSNLQILTKAEHCLKTAKANPERGKKAGEKKSKLIKSEERSSIGEIIIKHYLSVKEACKSLNITSKRINLSIKSAKPDSKGIQWSEVNSKTTDLEGEIWKPVPEKPSIEISNMGRVYIKNVASPYKDYGSPSPEGYLTVSVDGVCSKVHTLVCTVFHGNQPSDEHTVDHINRVCSDNRVENLRWATKSEQSRNTSRVKRIEAYNTTTFKSIEVFETQKDAADKYNCAVSRIQSMVTLRRNHGCLELSIKSHPNVSFRYADITIEEKKQREFDLVQYRVDIYNKQNNKRKENPLNLPLHIYHYDGRYSFVGNLLGNKIRKSSCKLEDMLELKETWTNTIIEQAKNKLKP